MNDAPSISFVEAGIEDESCLLAMMRALVEQEPAGFFDEPALRATFRQFLERPQFGRVWLIFADEKLAGYIVLTIGFSFEFRGHDAFIDELYIVPEFRRRGLGRKAVEFLGEEARRAGVTAVHLEVDPGNDPAIELYRRSGYLDHGRHLMTKWLVQSKSRSSPA